MTKISIIQIQSHAEQKITTLKKPRHNKHMKKKIANLHLDTRDC